MWFFLGAIAAVIPRLRAVLSRGLIGGWRALLSCAIFFLLFVAALHLATYMNAGGRFTYLSARCRCSLVLLYSIFLYGAYICYLTVPSTVSAPIQFISCIKQKEKINCFAI